MPLGLSDLRAAMSNCTACDLHICRSQIVFGEGLAHSPKVMFVGEAPGEEEDKIGRPFVGKAGEKLNEMIQFLGLDRDEVYIANAVLCRPLNNRDPHIEEILACRERLGKQILAVQPQLLILLGRVAVRAILGYDFKGPLKQFMEDEKFLDVEIQGQSFKAAVVAHPSYHLRNRRQAAKYTGKQWHRIKKHVKEAVSNV